MNLSQAKPMPKQLNLNKLGDTGGSQSYWLSDAAKNQFCMLFVYIYPVASYLTMCGYV
ncbi:MAG: hypothetical protein JSR39_06685 [Verrucomicrobia bacterium]|nr:hypothetical protein [Verrucomicrobiota bacterium]